MPFPTIPLRVDDHNRDASDMRYVYPVISRRAGGVSVGINLNPNSACNWRCIYCQVPNLARGGPPPIDLTQLAAELGRMLADITHGDFMVERVPPESRRLVDLAFSGNGEPTSAPEFSQAVSIAEAALRTAGLVQVKLRLITNGSLLDRATVREGVAALGRAQGEAWFKLDAANPHALQLINGTRQHPTAVLRRLLACATLCETWVQSCFFALDGNPPDEKSVHDYLSLLAPTANQLAGVHLYGLARPSQQVEAPRLQRLPAEWLDTLADRIRALGLTVQVSP